LWTENKKKSSPAFSIALVRLLSSIDSDPDEMTKITMENNVLESNSFSSHQTAQLEIYCVPRNPFFLFKNVCFYRENI